MYQGPKKKAGVEGAIPAKGSAFGDAGGSGLGDSRSQKQNADGAPSLGDLYPRFRNTGAQAAGTHGPAASHPSLMKSAMQSKAEASGPQLSAPARSIAAMLTNEHAALDAEAAEGQRLAARFVRRPEDEVCGSSKGSVAPYVAAGAFVLLMAGGAAAYFLTLGGGAQSGGGYVSASFATPYVAASGEPQPQAAAGSPQPQTTGSASWNEAVENFRALAASGGPVPEKVAEPKLEQLATGLNTARDN